MKTIREYHFQENVLSIPKGAKILCIQLVFDMPTLFVEVDTTKTHEKRVFKSYDSNSNLPENPGKYIGTVVLKSNIAKHFYEKMQ